MCLKRWAHGVESDHALFQGPFPVTLKTEMQPTPPSYRRYYDGESLPNEIAAVAIDQADYSEVDDLKPGTVAGGWNFLDSPDCEVFARGVNSKGPSAVSLSRQGSLFQWGFAAEPARMTPTGRALFLNAVQYISKHDHAPRLVKKTMTSRRWAIQAVRKDAVARVLMEADAPYLYCVERRKYLVDEDAKAIGIGNADPKLLEHCVAQLETDKDVERCRRILERYTDQSHDSAAAWRAWLDEARPHLFFSDLGGYRWFRSDAPMRAAKRVEGNSVGSNTFAIQAALRAMPGGFEAGQVVTLEVTLDHGFGWHSYAQAGKSSPFSPNKVRFELPEGVRAVGRMQSPKGYGKPGERGVLILEGQAVYRQRIRLPADFDPASGKGLAVMAEVSAMVCDEERCLPPQTLSAIVTLPADG